MKGIFGSRQPPEPTAAEVGLPSLAAEGVNGGRMIFAVKPFALPWVSTSAAGMGPSFRACAARLGLVAVLGVRLSHVPLHSFVGRGRDRIGFPANHRRAVGAVRFK